MKGRKPKPTRVKAAAGNPGKRPLNEQEPEFPQANLPEPPAHVASSEYALAEWNRVVPHLCRVKMLTVVDMAQIEAYCLAQGHLIEAELEIRESAIVVDEEHPGGKDSPGYTVLKKHPAVTVLYESMKALRSIGSEFGLSPASRSRVACGEPAEPAKPDKRKGCFR